MKKFFCILLSCLVFMTSCSISNQKKILPKITQKIAENKKEAAVEAEAKAKSYTKAIGIINNNDYDLNFINDAGFDTVVLRINGIRTAKAPYKTDFTELKKLEKTTSVLDVHKIKYYIEITSGPGYSSDGTIASIFDKEIERLYFSQMVRELLNRYNGNINFKGISIKLEDPDISTVDYYKTENYILEKVRETYPQTTALYNLHPLTFEGDLNDLPVAVNENDILNLTIYFKGIVYPGYGAGYKSSIKLDKNDMLKKFQSIKEFETKNKQHIMITIQIPWAEKSDVFLQDTFEIFKMIGFDYTLCYGNSLDVFDFSKNESVVKVLKRHSN